ncbi:cupin domain-containing protein [Candidatus Woesearchaeota archaeon]|nr:cupin domain-containing protein [Candidatus Woesearchaeota archaeon]
MKEGFNINLNEIMNFSEGGINSRVLAKSENYNYTLMNLAKGTDIDTHTSTKAGFVQILKGKGTFKLFNNEIKLEPGVFIFMPANAPHSLKADEDLAMFLCLNSE